MIDPDGKGGAVYFYESCSILASPKGESKYK